MEDDGSVAYKRKQRNCSSSQEEPSNQVHGRGSSSFGGRQEEGLQNETPVFGSVGQRTCGSDDRARVCRHGERTQSPAVYKDCPGLLVRLFPPHVLSGAAFEWAVGGIPRTIRNYSFVKDIGWFIIRSIPGIP